jgi:hypothetical protein
VDESGDWEGFAGGSGVLHVRVPVSGYLCRDRFELSKFVGVQGDAHRCKVFLQSSGFSGSRDGDDRHAVYVGLLMQPHEGDLRHGEARACDDGDRDKQFRVAAGIFTR